MASSSLPSPINPDGTLNKFPIPLPDSILAKAAASGDLQTVSSAVPDLLSEPTSIEFNNTPLIWAANQGQTAVLQHLLSVLPSSSVNHRGYLGNTALSRAARAGHVECVRLLLGAPGIDPNIGNDKKQYPLHFAAFKKKRECVAAMLESGIPAPAQ